MTQPPRSISISVAAIMLSAVSTVLLSTDRSFARSNSDASPAKAPQGTPHSVKEDRRFFVQQPPMSCKKKRAVHDASTSQWYCVNR